jgi:sodium-dependent dicarboxylate transporter 2/3/5
MSLPNTTIRLKLVGIALATGVVSSVSFAISAHTMESRAAIVAVICLGLWLTEVVPPFVPTLVLWVAAPVLLGSSSDEFELVSVLRWSADPVLALFFGGFALSVAATRHGIDERIVAVASQFSGGHRIGLVSVAAFATAVLSMWMSNIAAAAMMIAALRPLYGGMERQEPFRRALLLAIAFGADFGGIATPVGSGPNAIAVAAASRQAPVTFLGWMMFGVPLAAALTTAAVALLVARFHVHGRIVVSLPSIRPWSAPSIAVVIVFLATVAAWLTEPLHGISSATISLATSAVLFASGLLKPEDLGQIDWATLMLIGGGLALGRLLEESGLITSAIGATNLADTPRMVALFVLVLASATLSAFMSNTATATMLVPLAAAVDPSASTVILVAVGASLGVPLVISTPPNAMAYGEGIKASDLLVPGLILMLGGCVLIALTGPAVLQRAGIP